MFISYIAFVPNDFCVLVCLDTQTLTKCCGCLHYSVQERAARVCSQGATDNPTQPRCAVGCAARVCVPASEMLAEEHDRPTVHFSEHVFIIKRHTTGLLFTWRFSSSDI